MVDVILIGGGAGGGGATSGTASQGNNNGTGGGPGCFMYVPNYPATPSGTISYTIGTAGAGGVASGTTNATFSGGTGGNTTFGGLVAPGGGTKVGSLGVAMSRYQRGGFGIQGHFDSTSNLTILSGTISSWNAQGDPTASGFPLGVPGAFVSYTDTYSGGASVALGATYPPQGPGGDSNGIQANQNNPLGVKKSFNRILNDFEEPSGTAGATSTGSSGTGGVLTGWNGIGGQGVSGLTAPAYPAVPGYGAGGGGSFAGNANLTAAGAAAAVNSGAGGGGGAARAAQTSMVNQLANGGAGGSGVIFLGYWA
jgi:hypothetical protein